MSQLLNLQIVIPEKILLQVQCNLVTIPSTSGEIGILPGHISLITTLNSGVLTYSSNHQIKKIALHWGYAEIHNNQVMILAELAELAEYIDLDRAKTAQLKVEKALQEITDEQKVTLLKTKLFRSLTRQQALK